MNRKKNKKRNTINIVNKDLNNYIFLKEESFSNI